MRRLLVALLVVLLSGCAALVVEGPPHLGELLSDSHIKQKAFMQCMQNYGKAHAGSHMSTFDIAIDATGSCDAALQRYHISLSAYYDYKAHVYNEDWRYYDENNQRKLRNDIEALVAEGKRATIIEVVQVREKLNPKR
jgi:uncharacterized protein YceK